MVPADLSGWVLICIKGLSEYVWLGLKAKGIKYILKIECSNRAIQFLVQTMSMVAEVEM